MADDDELFASILSLCEEESTENVAVVGKEDSKENNFSFTQVSPIKGSDECFPVDRKQETPGVTPLKLVVGNESILNQEKGVGTPAGTPGFNKFRSMFLNKGKTSTPILDKWSFSKTEKVELGKKRSHTAKHTLLESITEHDSSDEEQTLRHEDVEADGEETYEDLLQDLTMLCEKEIMERREKVGDLELPENNIKAENQISRIDLDSILLVTSTKVSGNTLRDEGDNKTGETTAGPHDKEPGRFTGVNTTSRSSMITTEDSDSFEETEDILGLDTFLLSDEEDDKSIDSLVEETILCDTTIVSWQEAKSRVQRSSEQAKGTQVQTSIHKIASEEIKIESRTDSKKEVRNEEEQSGKKEGSDKEDPPRQSEEKQFVKSSEDESDEFALDLTKDSDEIDEFLTKEGFKIIDDLKNSFDSECKDENISEKCEDNNVPVVNKTKTDKTAKPIQHKKGKAEDQSIQTKSQKHTENDTNHKSFVKKTSSENISDEKGTGMTQVCSLEKVTKWQDNIAAHDQSPDGEDLKSKLKTPSVVSSSLQKKLTPPKMQVHPFQMVSKSQSSPECHKSTAPSKTLLPNETRPEGIPHLMDHDSSSRSSSHKNPVASGIVSCSPNKLTHKLTAPAGSISDSILSDVTFKENESAPPTSQPCVPKERENAQKKDELDNVVSTSNVNLYYDYEAERQFIQGDNYLIRQVMEKWGSKGIQSPDTNLTFSNRLRQVNHNKMSRLEGQKISTLWMESSNSQAMDVKRLKMDKNSQLNNINNLKCQLQNISKTCKIEADNVMQEYREKRFQQESLFGYRTRALQTQQQLEIRQVHAQKHCNPYMIQCQLLQLKCEHQQQKEKLQFVLNTEMNQLEDFYQGKIRKLRVWYEQKTDQLKSFIQQLESVEDAQTDHTHGPHIVTHLAKGPCRSNKNSWSTVTVCLPADIATSIIREDEVYDAYYECGRR